MEERELDAAARKELGGTFAELTDGWTHYKLEGGGDGAIVVLIHGNAVPSATWDRTVPALLEANFRTLRYDIYGHGFSDRPDLKTYDKSLYDRQLAELLESLGISAPVFMAGTSQGGSIAASFAAGHPARIGKLALLAPLFDEFSGKGAARLLKGPFGEFILKLSGEKALTDPSRGLHSKEFNAELTEKLKAQIAFKGKTRAVLANIRGDVFSDPVSAYEEVGRQGIPLMLTLGEFDRAIPRKSMDRLRGMIPDTEYHMIPEAAHLAHYEAAERINPLLTEFFSS